MAPLAIVQHGKEASFRRLGNTGSSQNNKANKDFWRIRSKPVDREKWQQFPSKTNKQTKNLKIGTEQIEGFNALRRTTLETYLIWEKDTSLFLASFLFWKKKKDPLDQNSLILCFVPFVYLQNAFSLSISSYTALLPARKY